jgi:hypothetical protein
MTRALTFENFDLSSDGLGSIYEIGADEDHPTGVIPEMASVFGHELSATPDETNLGELIKSVGPAKELQNNIALVRDILGTDQDAVSIARSWSERSGLLTPVERSYFTAEQLEGRVGLAVITGGVRNWMARRAQRLETLVHERGVDSVLLVAGNREMKATEGPDVEEGMSEADYMENIVARKISGLGIANNLIRVDSGVGDQVMEAGVVQTFELVSDESARIAVVSNAGAWVQNVGQFRRAAINKAGRQFDERGDQIFAVSDGFPLGTGEEPTATHQNPFTALGQIARNAQELVRHK